MVFKGAGGRSAKQIVEVIEAEGGHINAATGYERALIVIPAAVVSFEGRHAGVNVGLIPAAGGVLFLQFKLRLD